MKQFGFGKAEKLKSSKSISELFAKGNSEFKIHTRPIKLLLLLQKKNIPKHISAIE
jgi:hypothetical protein